MKKISICVLSDTHNKHKHILNLPEADVIIHCGDMTSIGKEHEIHNFFKWFSKLKQYKHKICISGNHDWLFEKNRKLALSHKPYDVTYLEDSEIIIDGFKFYGSPVQPIFFNWAFNRPEEKLKQHWQAIPDDVDVLITHCPPHGILDVSPYDNKNCGSPSLYFEIVNRIKCPLSLFGHIHSGYGIKIIENTTFINASNLNEEYFYVNNPILIEIDENKNVTIIN